MQYLRRGAQISMISVIVAFAPSDICHLHMTSRLISHGRRPPHREFRVMCCSSEVAMTTGFP